MAKTDSQPNAGRRVPQNNKKNTAGIQLPFWAPHAIVIGLFLIVLLAYFSPLTQGKVLNQGDIQQGRGMSKELNDWRANQHEEPLWTGQMFSGMPGYQISMLNYGNFIEKLDVGMKLGLPNPVAMFMWMFIGFYILLLVLKVDPWIAGACAAGYALSSYFFIALEAGHNSKINALSYIAPILAGIILLYEGRYYLGGAITLLFMSLELTANHPQITYYFLIVIFFMLVSQFIFSILEKKLKAFLISSGILAGVFVIAIGPSIPRIWSTYDYSKETIRGTNDLSDGKDPQNGLKLDYALQWSYGIGETMTLLVPNFMGGSSGDNVGLGSRTHAWLEQHPRISQLAYPDGTKLSDELSKSWSSYRGDQPFTSGPVYIGAIFIFLFFVGLVLVENKYKWWILAATILMTMLAWGRNYLGLTQFFFDHVPMYNKFRAPAMMLVVAEFTVPLLAALGLSYIVKNKDKISIKKFYAAMGTGLAATVGICLILITSADSIVPKSLSDDADKVSGIMGQVGIQLQGNEVATLVKALHDDRASMISSDAMRSAGLVLAAALLIFVWFTGRMKLKPVLFGGLGILILVDLYPIDRRYLNEKSFAEQAELDKPYQETPTDISIHKDPDPHYRVLKLTRDAFQKGNSSYHHKTIGGYHPAKLRRYNDIIDRAFTVGDSTLPNYRRGEFDRLYGLSYGIRQQIKEGPMPKEPFQGEMAKTPVLNMLNTKYLILTDGDYCLNPYRLGNAWFVSEYKIVDSAGAEISAVTGDFSPAKTAIIGKDFSEFVKGFTPAIDSAGSILLTKYSPRELDYKFKASSEQLVVFSEVYYDGNGSWQVTIDDQPAKHFRANYLLRALRVPKGEHNIVFKFEPRSYVLGNKIAILCSLLVLAGFVGGVYMDYKQRKEKSSEVV